MLATWARRVRLGLGENIDSGHYILLEDQSLWEIDVLDRIDALLWLTVESITVAEDGTCPWSYRLINSDDSSTACARFLSYSR